MLKKKRKVSIYIFSSIFSYFYVLSSFQNVSLTFFSTWYIKNYTWFSQFCIQKMMKNSPNVFGLIAPKKSVFPSYKVKIKHG